MSSNTLPIHGDSRPALPPGPSPKGECGGANSPTLQPSGANVTVSAKTKNKSPSKRLFDYRKELKDRIQNMPRDDVILNLYKKFQSMSLQQECDVPPKIFCKKQSDLKPKSLNPVAKCPKRSRPNDTSMQCLQNSSLALNTDSNWCHVYVNEKFHNKAAGFEAMYSNEKSINHYARINFKDSDFSDIKLIDRPNIYQLMGTMILENRFPDIKIRCGNSTFNCHQLVLNAYTNFFYNHPDYPERMIVLPADKVSADMFDVIYEWMILDDQMLAQEGILKLFIAAKYLEIDELVKQCSAIFDNPAILTEADAFMFFLQASEYNIPHIQACMLKRIHKFFYTVVAAKEFLDLRIESIITLLSNNGTGVNQEGEIFYAAALWLSFDWKNRRRYLREVMACVRFPLIPPLMLVSICCKEKNDEIRRIVVDKFVQESITNAHLINKLKMDGSDRSEDYCNRLKEHGIELPQQRSWIYDATCHHHYRPNHYVPVLLRYDIFLEFLQGVRRAPVGQWKLLCDLEEDMYEKIVTKSPRK